MALTVFSRHYKKINFEMLLTFSPSPILHLMDGFLSEKEVTTHKQKHRAEKENNPTIRSKLFFCLIKDSHIFRLRKSF